MRLVFRRQRRLLAEAGGLVGSQAGAHWRAGATGPTSRGYFDRLLRMRHRHGQQCRRGDRRRCQPGECMAVLLIDSA